MSDDPKERKLICQLLDFIKEHLLLLLGSVAFFIILFFAPFVIGWLHRMPAPNSFFAIDCGSDVLIAYFAEAITCVATIVLGLAVYNQTQQANERDERFREEQRDEAVKPYLILEGVSRNGEKVPRDEQGHYSFCLSVKEKAEIKLAVRNCGKGSAVSLKVKPPIGMAFGVSLEGEALYSCPCEKTTEFPVNFFYGVSCESAFIGTTPVKLEFSDVRDNRFVQSLLYDIYPCPEYDDVGVPELAGWQFIIKSLSAPVKSEKNADATRRET